jgi:hypothetical protein
MAKPSVSVGVFDFVGLGFLGSTNGNPYQEQVRFAHHPW